VHRAGHHLACAGSAGRQRARVARRGGQRDHRRRPRRAQQMRGDGEAEAKYNIRVNCDLCGKRLRTGSRRGECEQTPECRREHRRPPAR
jgi:hypothetical protein